VHVLEKKRICLRIDEWRQHTQWRVAYTVFGLTFYHRRHHYDNALIVHLFTIWTKCIPNTKGVLFVFGLININFEDFFCVQASLTKL